MSAIEADNEDLPGVLPKTYTKLGKTFPIVRWMRADLLISAKETIILQK